MPLSAARRRAVADVEDVCRRDLDSRALRRGIVHALAPAVGHHAFCFGSMDPATLLITDDVSAGIPASATGPAVRNEYLVPDVHKFSRLARSGAGTAILSRASGVEHSARYRTVLPLIDATDELRASFVADGQCWGGLAMFRDGAGGAFSPADAAVLRTVATTVARALRRATPRSPGDGVGTDLEVVDRPGTLIVGPADVLLSLDDAAASQLAELDGSDGPVAGGVGPGGLPRGVREVVAAARANRTAATPASGSDAAPPAFVRARTRAGRWLSLHGSALHPQGDRAGAAEDTVVAIVVQAAARGDITDIMALSHGLTARERDLLAPVIAGLTTGQIARRLGLSPHTVHDHLKSVFDKVGARSRAHLVARLLDQHCLP